MALTHKSSLFDIDEGGISPLATDVAGSLATYGTLVRLPGIKSVQADFEMLTKELYGDAGILDYKAKIRKVTGTATCARHDLDVMASLLGGTVTDAGTTPNQIASMVHTRTDIPGYFKLQGRIREQSFLPGSTTSDEHLVFYKCKISGYSFGGAEEDYAVPSFQFVGFSLEGNATVNGATAVSPMFAIEERETGATLS